MGMVLAFLWEWSSKLLALRGVVVYAVYSWIQQKSIGELVVYN